jgi:hypothetical protein
MDEERFDAIARAVASARSRRDALRLAVAALAGLAAVPSAETGAADLGVAACGVGGAVCRGGGDCCSGVCQKKKRKKGKNNKNTKKKKRPRKGACTSLGPLAADCPASNICGPSDPRVPCFINGEEGFCIGVSPNSAFCATATVCSTETSAICATDEDCEGSQEPGFRCLLCDNGGCFGNRLCALPAGAG